MFNNVELNMQYNRLKELIEIAKNEEFNEELRSHLTKYICVLCSGFIENSVYHTFCDIAENNCAPSVVLTYTKTQLYKVQNANSDKIRELTKSFNPEWNELLTRFMQDDDRSSAINYILKDRHNIAHGRNSNITILQLEIYLNKTIEVFKFIETNLI